MTSDVSAGGGGGDGSASDIDLLWDGRRDTLTLTDGRMVRAIHVSVDDGGAEERFSHDGHINTVVCSDAHSSVDRLVFSADAKGSLHAWLYENEA